MTLQEVIRAELTHQNKPMSSAELARSIRGTKYKTTSSVDTFAVTVHSCCRKHFKRTPDKKWSLGAPQRSTGSGIDKLIRKLNAAVDLLHMCKNNEAEATKMIGLAKLHTY